MVVVQGCGFLTQAQGNPSRLEQVNFGCNALHEAGARALTHGLRQLVSLRKLAISETAIEDAGGLHFSAFAFTPFLLSHAHMKVFTLPRLTCQLHL